MSWYRINHDHVLVQVKIKTNANEDRIVDIYDDRLRINLRAKPIAGEANGMLIRFLSKRLHLTQDQIAIEVGETSRQKRLRLPLTEKVHQWLLNIDKEHQETEH